MKLKVDGKAVFAATGGKPLQREQPCVVFIHGAGMNHTVWAMQARYFAHHGYGVLGLDLPGHGASGGPALESIDETADWLLRMLDAAKVERATLVGHSMGGLIALAAAAAAPERVEKLAILGGSGTMPVVPALLELARADDPRAYDLMVLWGHHLGAQIGGHPTPGLWLMGGSLRLLARGAKGVLATDLAACNAYSNGFAAAAKVRCPALLLIGERDVMTPPRAGRALARAIAEAEVAMIPGGGHLVLVEQPDALLDALRGFV